jgi:uncharacterized YkwD family protein
MRKYKVLFSAVAVMLVLASVLGGCTYQPARRYIQTDPNNIGTPNAPAIPNNVVGKAGNNNTDGNRISATYEVVDFSYITINGNSQKVRAGAGTQYPSIGTITSGQKIRALGKLDGWYVVKLPDSGRIGCIPSANARPSGTTGTRTTNTNITTGTGTVTPAPRPGTTTGAGTAAGGTAAGGGTAAAGSGVMSSDEARILQLVNAERAKAGAKALSSNSDCTKLARMKSQDMVNKNYFSHQSPTYGSPFDMLKSNNVSYMYAGENIAMNQTVDAAFKAWMNSEGHRKNIMNPNFTELGVGIAPKGNGSYIYTQLFIGR